MQFSIHGRNRVTSVDNVVRKVTRRKEGIRRLLNSRLTESLRQYHQDALTLSPNFKWLRSVLYPLTYQRTLTLVMSLCKEIENVINLRNVADRNSNGSRNNEGNKNTPNTGNVLPPNLVTNNISITSATTSGITPIRAENKRQNLNDALSEAQVVKAPRLKIDWKKLEHLISVGFPVRKIAKVGLFGKKLHHNTVHNSMARNYMQHLRQKFLILSDD